MTPDELRQRIKNAQDRQAQDEHKAQPTPRTRADSVAFRAATDLVAGVAVGAFLGYWIDRWLGSTPLGMITLLFLGFIAGFMNIYRSQMAPTPAKDAGAQMETKSSETKNKGS